MYWEGDTEWMACGTGAASYANNIRFTRPKSLQKYYQYVDQIKSNTFLSTDLIPDTQLQKVETITMCGLRTVQGVKWL